MSPVCDFSKLVNDCNNLCRNENCFLFAGLAILFYAVFYRRPTVGGFVRFLILKLTICCRQVVYALKHKDAVGAQNATETTTPYVEDYYVYYQGQSHFFCLFRSLFVFF